MSKRTLVIQGHPDALGPHLCHALAQAYAAGASAAGHETRVIEPTRLDFPLLRSAKAWNEGSVPEELKAAQESISWAEHIGLFFPLWLGDMPALLKGFLEQVLRPCFAFIHGGDNRYAKNLTGRSARVVVTMGMPALIYRFYFRAHSVKSLERNILGFSGFSPVSETLIGGVESLGPEGVASWIAKLNSLGQRAE